MRVAISFEERHSLCLHRAVNNLLIFESKFIEQNKRVDYLGHFSSFITIASKIGLPMLDFRIAANFDSLVIELPSDGSQFVSELEFVEGCVDHFRVEWDEFGWGEQLILKWKEIT